MSPSRDRDPRHDHGTSLRLPSFPTTPDIEEQLAEGFSIADLVRAYGHLRDRYEASQRTPRNLSATAVAAYAVARLPATFAATVDALRQVASALGGWEPRSLIDVGSGLGSSAWAALSVFPTLSRLTLVEDSDAMTVAGQALATRSNHPALRDAHWVTATATSKLDRADLVIASYVLGELDEPEAAVRDWWRASTGVAVVIEPGSPAGYQRILRARGQLISAGARIAAPCPHESPCPRSGSGWCHFGVTVARSRLHRDVKDGTLPSEDEKFSYVAATREAMRVRRPRLVREPSRHGGHVRLELCAEAGIVEKTVSKRDPDYGRIRKLGWGDALPQSALFGGAG
jgi:ribosomal protein RSM22 (predicted rRNA methylase)